MEKEIFEQPRAVRDALLGCISQVSGKVFLDQMDIADGEFRNFLRDVKIVAGGTSWHAGLAGKSMNLPPCNYLKII
jgi:glutamine---fructose-6-phosphate transaminase (isomerizing)